MIRFLLRFVSESAAPETNCMLESGISGPLKFSSELKKEKVERKIKLN